MPQRTPPKRVFVGVADHSGWAILVTASSDGSFLERRRVELVDDGLPRMPHHHEGQKLPLAEAVALVGQVKASAERNSQALLRSLADELPQNISGIALRACPTLPATVAERITSYRAMCVADWVMYREALAKAASERGWRVHWYDAKRVLDDAARALTQKTLEERLEAAKRSAGSPWQKDHRVAMAAAIVGGLS